MMYTVLILALAASISASVLPKRALTSVPINVTEFQLSAASYDIGAVYRAELELPNEVSFCYFAPRVDENSTWCADTPAINGFEPRECENHHFSWSMTPTAPPAGSDVPHYLMYVNLTQENGPVLRGCYELRNDFYCAPSDQENPNQMVSYTNTYIDDLPAITFTLDDVETPACANAGP